MTRDSTTYSPLGHTHTETGTPTHVLHFHFIVSHSDPDIPMFGCIIMQFDKQWTRSAKYLTTQICTQICTQIGRFGRTLWDIKKIENTTLATGSYFLVKRT